MPLPPDILQRSERVYAYHLASWCADGSTGRLAPGPQAQPSVYRLFEGFPRVQLPTTLLDAPIPALVVMRDGLEGLPESQLNPPHNLKTLASWLYMTYGLSKKVQVDKRTTTWLRPTPSIGSLYPCEIYVAAFAIDDLEPGLYHFSPRTFSLYKLREGLATLYQLKRGRPDLEFLKGVPAALLVSTIYGRSSSVFGMRGYRCALIDAGHLIQSLVTAGTGLGLQTLTRLRLNDSATRELIGVPPDVDYGQAENVQGMVVWADPAPRPISLPTVAPAASPMPPIPRSPLASQVEAYPQILEVQRESMAPGLGRIEMRPPVTEISPVPGTQPGIDLPLDDMDPGHPLREVLLTRQPMTDFSRQSVSRSSFLWLNRLALRGGTYFPLHPDGPHMALVRPYWIVNDVIGLESGVWYYNVKSDHWSSIQLGEFRFESKYLSAEQECCGNAGALCFLTANLQVLMGQVNPDAYRLAHLEAGIVGQRLHVAAAALNLGTCAMGTFYDVEARRFLNLHQTGWEPLAEFAIGEPPGSDGGGLHFKADDGGVDANLGWRG